MEIDIATYRARIGQHYYKHLKTKGVTSLDYFEYYAWIRILLLRSGDIEMNPGRHSDTSSSDSYSTSDHYKKQFFLGTLQRSKCTTQDGYTWI